MAGHEQFLEFCRSMKPPYQCPITACGRIYKSLAGIHTHMTTYDHANLPTTPAATSTNHSSSTGRKKGQKRPASPSLGQVITCGDSEPPPVPFSTDMKNVEFELDGKQMKVSVYDPIEMMSKEEFEASLPPSVEETPIPEAAKTPASNKTFAKTPSHKTPKGRPPANASVERGCDIQRYTIEDKRTKGLPEASFTIIENYYATLPDAPPLTEQYYKFVEKTNQELAAEVEYDLDEEDCAWLELVNEQRCSEQLEPVELQHLQLLMDRLEKESFFQAESSGRSDSGVVPIDEDAVCCICMDGECQNSNVILFCDMCNLAVHQECYGVPYIPEGQWLCRRCLQSPSRAVDCALCPNKGGAFKQTDDGRWAHVVCAMWIPEVCFANTVFLEPIDSIGNIPPARWKLTCYICKQRGVGACIQCNKANCYTAFHVTCAQQASLHMKIDAIRETSTSGTSVTVRKAAYCDLHTPHDTDQGSDGEAGCAAKRAAEAKVAWRQKMKKARKILAEKRSAAPLVAVPTIPPDRIQALAGLIEGVTRVSQFMNRLLAFWTLKRQSRNGVPLLRRLINAHSSRRNLNSSNSSAGNTSLHNMSVGGVTGGLGGATSPVGRSNIIGLGGANRKVLYDGVAEEQPEGAAPRAILEKSENNKPDESKNKRKEGPRKKGEGAPAKKRRLLTARPNNNKNKDPVPRPVSRCLSPWEDVSALAAQIKYWQMLRQDLEKARLLCELISKREREKKKMILVCSELRLVQLSPMVSLQLRVIQQLLERDVQQIFAEPVDLDEVKDYSDVVTHPMDLSTMKGKAERHEYRNMDDLEKDFDLMIDNCLAYNSKETIFFKAAHKLRDQGSGIFSVARRSVGMTGFDLDTGLLSPQRPKPPPVLSDAAIIKQVDEYLSSQRAADDEAELRRLLDLAYQVSYHVARNTRVRAIRRQLTRLRHSKTDGHKAESATHESAEDEFEEDAEGGPDTQSGVNRQSGSPRHLPAEAAEEPTDATATTKDPRQRRKPTAGVDATRPEQTTTAGNTAAPAVAKQQLPPPSSPLPPSKQDEASDIPTVTTTTTTTTSTTATVAATTATVAAAGNAPSPEAKEQTGERARGKGTVNRRGRGSAKRQDYVKQKRIDSFFQKVATKTDGDSATDSSDAPPPATAVTADPVSIAPGKTLSSDEEGEGTPRVSSAAPRRGAPARKRGRPYKRPRHRGTRETDIETKTSSEDLVQLPLSSPPLIAPLQAITPTEEACELDATSSTLQSPALTLPTVGDSMNAEEKSLGGKNADGSGVSNDKETEGANVLGAVGGSQPTPSLMDACELGGIVDLHEGETPLHKDSFKFYRTGGEKAPDTDEETHSESTSSLGDSDDDSCSDSDSDGRTGRGPGGVESESSVGGEGGGGSGEGQGRSAGQEIQLEPLDLVWAKCRGYPWYPALIINPKMPRTGYFHNHVPIPVPPQEVLDLAHTCPLTHQYLVLFFDSKRTWQWLPRSKLEPLGERPALDKAKLVESRKPADRKAVKRAYEQAILHRCRVTGEHDGLTGESEGEAGAVAE